MPMDSPRYRQVESAWPRIRRRARAVCLFHPYLQGERSPYWDPHLTRRLCRASTDDIAWRILRALSWKALHFRCATVSSWSIPLANRLTQLYLIGGGAKSQLWSQIVCDVTGSSTCLKPVMNNLQPMALPYWLALRQACFPRLGKRSKGVRYFANRGFAAGQLKRAVNSMTSSFSRPTWR